MADIKIELAHTKIVNFSADVNIEESAAIKIESTYAAEVYEPKDMSDPTAMVLAKCSMKDTEGKYLNIECTAELYFTFNPLPENRIKAIQEVSREVVQRELTQRICILLREMGQNISIN